MSKLPAQPVSPREFVEDVIPSLFAEFVLGDEADTLDLKLGFSLRGEGGGDWTLHFVEGELGIAEGLAEDCGGTVVQDVEDWRAALWEGRPALVAEGLRQAIEREPGAPLGSGHFAAPSNPEAFRELEQLPGLIEAWVESAGDEDPWRIGFLIGPGPVPEAPQATIRMGADEAEAMRRGELHPLEALIQGQLRLEGDLGLIFRLQAIALAASLPPMG